MKKFDKRMVISIVFIIITIYAIFNFIEQEVRIYKLGTSINEVSEELTKEEAKNKELVQEKEALGHMEYIEKVAREELGLTKPGEIPYIPSHKNQ